MEQANLSNTNVCKTCGSVSKEIKCNSCVKAYNREYYAKNREAINARRAIQRAKKTQHDSKRALEWYRNNKEKVSQRNADAYRSCPEKFLERSAKWRKENPDKARAIKQNRRARGSLAGGKLSVGIIESLMKLQNGKCACCGKPLNRGYHLDHIMPLSLGGGNVDSNVQLLAPKCNLQKSAKHPIEFMQSKGYLL